MNEQKFKNGNFKFPLSTDALDFLQEQVRLVYGLASLAGQYIIINQSTQRDGLIIVNGELMPLVAGAPDKRIVVREVSEDIVALGVTYSGVRVKRYAEYTSEPIGAPASFFSVMKSMQTLQTELEAAKRHYMPKYSVIDYAGPLTIGDIPDGWVPCGVFKTGTTAEINAELAQWQARYGSSLRNVGLSGTLRFDKVNGVSIPDLTDRFVVQAGNSYAYGEPGGEKEVTLTKEQMPSHNHSCNPDQGHYHEIAMSWSSLYTGNGSGSEATKVAATGTTNTKASGAHSHNIGSAGGGVPHNNMPPYMALYKLIKVI